MNWFARVFVLINRVFGAATVAIGISLVAISFLRWWRFGSDATVWIVLLSGVGAVGVGYLYLTAPLSRQAGGRERDKGRAGR